MQSTPNVIKPIETVYKGHRFRSRLEARWAVFFDSLSITWEYEPTYEEVEFRFEHVRYSPDFYLPDLDYWLEIKPQEPRGVEITKAAGWAKDIGDIYVLYDLDAPDEDTDSGWLFTFTVSRQGQKVIREKGYWWTECLKCGAVALTLHGDAPEECIGKCYSDDELEALYEETGYAAIDDSYPYSPRSPRLMGAYRAAKAMQFGNSEQDRLDAARHFASERRRHRQEAALETYATKKYGENWEHYQDYEVVREEFDEWLARKQGYGA